MRSFCAVLLLGSVAAGVAHADEMRVSRDGFGEVRSVTVHYEDLDLSRQAGAEAMLNRLRQAARRVCAAGESRDLARSAVVENCLRDTMSRAVASVPSSTVQGLYAEETHGHVDAERVAGE